MPSTNLFLLAADNSPELLPQLHANPSLASNQDEHGYSLIHAASSYNLLELLRTLVKDFHVDVELRDEDGETALFVAETVDCAKVLVEELQADVTARSTEGKTARQRIEEEGEFPEVAIYLRIKEQEGSVCEASLHPSDSASHGVYVASPLPPGISVDIGVMAPEDVGEVVDPELRRRIQELAEREDFQREAGQQALRELVTDALKAGIGEEREVRRRTE